MSFCLRPNVCKKCGKPLTLFEGWTCIECEKAEQKPILDKIRDEIDVARFIDKDTRLCKNANASGLEVALEIIDKYKGDKE